MDAITVLLDNMPSLIQAYSSGLSDESFAIGVADDSDKSGLTIATQSLKGDRDIGLIEEVYNALTLGRTKNKRYHVELVRLECDGSYALCAVATKVKDVSLIKTFTDCVLYDVFISGWFKNADILPIL
jgi:hypothetical protein